MTTNWDKRFLELATLIATWSKDSTKVGAIAVGSDKEIISTGYNGPPRGVADTIERVGLPSSENPEKLFWCSHAEENLVAHAARRGLPLLNATVYVTHYPCSTCARLLIQSGVSRVCVGSGNTKMNPREFQVASEMFEEVKCQILLKS